MKTAVEWFANRISHGGLVSKKQFNELLEQAKKMEKEQIMRSHSSGYNSGLENKLVLSYEYYIKTFKSE